MGTIRSSVVRLSKHFSRKGLYPLLEEHFSQIPEGADVLNVGAGGEVEVALRHHAEGRSFKVVSLDIDPGRGPDMVGDVQDFDFGGRVFDAVVMAEVLEHVREPGLAVKAVHGALKPGGVLILSVPFLFPIHDRPDDYYRFTRYGLEWLLRDFAEVAVSARNSWAEALNVVFVRLIKEKNPGLRLAGPLIILFAALLHPVALVLGRLVKTDFATSGYVARAVK